MNKKSRFRPENKILKHVWSSWRPAIIRHVSEWADKKRILTRLTSSMPGRWKTSTFPYTKEPMDCYSNPFVRLIVLKWATQSGKTEVQLNCIGWTIDENPGPTLLVYPTDKVLNKVSNTRIQPMIEACASLREKKHRNPDKFKMSEMHFIDCILFLATAQAGSDISSMPIENFFGDELKDWPAYTSGGKGADPVKYGTDRQKNFPYTKKTILVSSPLDEQAPISKYFSTCQEQLYLFVPCPHCGNHWQFDFGQIKWDVPELLDSTNPELWRIAKSTAFYACPDCGGIIHDDHKRRMLSEYKWLRADGSAPDWNAESIGFHLSSIASPLITFGDIAHEFLECKNNPEKLKNFITGWLAEEWKQIIKQSTDLEILQAKTTLQPQTVPDQAIILTCGIDVQQYGFWFIVRAWAKDYVSWLIHYGFLESWDDIDNLLFNTVYPGPNNSGHKIWRAAIDTGGGIQSGSIGKTEETYWFVRQNGIGRGCRIWATKGSSTPLVGKIRVGKPLDKTPSGKPIPGGLQIIHIDTDQMKDAYHYRLSQAIINDAMGAYLHCNVGDDYVRQITAEEKRRDIKGRECWIATKKDNHLLDCEVLAMALAEPEWPGGGINLFQPSASAGPRRRVISRGINA